MDERKDPSELIGLYSNPDYYGAILDQTEIRSCDLESKVSFVTNMVFMFRDTEYLDQKLPELAEIIEYFSNPNHTSVDSKVWEDAFARSVSEENEIWRENVLVYILFKYLMTGLSGKDFYEKLMTGIVSVLSMSTCITALFDVIHHEVPSKDYILMLVSRLSRIIEHNNTAGKAVSGFFKEQGITAPGFVLKLIS